MFSYKKLLILHAIGWVAWGFLHTFIIHYAGFDWKQSAIESVISSVLLAAACFAMINVLRYYQPGKTNSSYLLLWSLALTGIWLWGVNQILSKIYLEDSYYLHMLSRSLPIRFCICFLIIGCMVLISWIRNNIKIQEAEKIKKEEIQRIAKETELLSLRQQLQPHFLFNSLNSISALVHSSPEQARSMIQQLSDFLRGTLKKNNQQQIALEEELQHVKLYLDIEKVRFGHRLHIALECEEESLKMTLPQLLLQPIIENAIKFGLYDTTETVTIHIKTKNENHKLVVSIQNPFDPTGAPLKGTGFGLDSIKRRLYLLYGRNDLVEIQIEGNTFTTLVKIPQQV